MLKKLNNKELNSLLEEFLTEVKEHFKIEKAVLYGSYAKGNPRPESDIDLLIVSNDLPIDSTKGMNGYRIISKLSKIYPIIELIAVNPVQLNNPVSKWFYDEIFSYGQTLK